LHWGSLVMGVTWSGHYLTLAVTSTEYGLSHNTTYRVP